MQPPMYGGLVRKRRCLELKRIILLMSALFVFSANCFAMTLSQPQKIGQIRYVNLPGFDLSDATSNNGEQMHLEGNRWRGLGLCVYKNGIARFGSDSNALYFHYRQGTIEKKYNDTLMAFGASDIRNTVNIDILCPYIFKINTNEGSAFYLLDDGYDPEGRITLIGRGKDGRWVKYFETYSIKKTYFGGQSYGVCFYQPAVIDNAIIIRYDRNFDGRNLQRNDIDEQGEFRFKWDDKAQWFSVEQVVH